MTAPGITKAAVAHLRDGKIFIQPSMRIGKCAWRHTTPVLVANEHDHGLGALVLLALSKSREEPGPPFFYKNEHEDPLLKTAGYRSYEAFYDTAKLISIYWDDSGILLTPSRNGGPGKRFPPVKKHIRCQPLEAEIESAVKAAFDACQH
jgi:hypothetical protein